MKQVLLILLLNTYQWPSYAQIPSPGATFHFSLTITNEYHDNKIRKRPESNAHCALKVECRVMASTDTTIKVEATIQSLKLEVRDETRFRFDSEEDKNSSNGFGRRSILVRNIKKQIDNPFEVLLNNKGEVVNYAELQNSYRFTDSMETLYGIPTLHSASIASLQLSVAGSLGEILRFTFTEKIKTQSVITTGTRSYDAFSADSVRWLERIPFIGKIKERTSLVQTKDIEQRQKDTIIVTRRSPEGIDLVHKVSNLGKATTQIKKDAIQFNTTVESEKKIALNSRLRVTRQESTTTEITTLSSDGISEKAIKISRESLVVDWP